MPIYRWTCRGLGLVMAVAAIAAAFTVSAAPTRSKVETARPPPTAPAMAAPAPEPPPPTTDPPPEAEPVALCPGAPHPEQACLTDAPRSALRGNHEDASPRLGGSSAGGNMSGGWAAVRDCESGGNYADADSPTYRGAYQFDAETWASVGGSGDPAAASPGEQDSRAQRLYAVRGSAPWPQCGRHLG